MSDAGFVRGDDEYGPPSPLDLLPLVPEDAKRVLEIGCGRGELGAALRQRQACEVVGIEADPGAAEAAKVCLSRVIQGDPEVIVLDEIGQFDVVICGDVLTKVHEPAKLLARLRAVLEPLGRMVARFPNVRHIDAVQRLAEGGWTSAQEDSPSLDTLQFFTRRTAEVLLEEGGFEITDVRGVPASGHAGWHEAGRPGQIQAGRLGISGLSREDAEEFFIGAWLLAAVPSPQPDWGLTSIVVVTWNQVAYTKLCLKSLRRHTRLPHELIVVDNGSTDGTVTWLAEQENVKLIRNAANLGFPKAANQGIAASQGRQVLLLNNDTVVTPGWLRRLLAQLHSGNDVGMVGPLSNFVSGAQLLKTPYHGLVGLDGFAWRLGRTNRGRYQETDRLVGFCLLIKKDVLDRIGLLDEQFGIGCFEDDDLCLRAVKAEYRLRICEDAFVHHFGGRTFVGNEVSAGQVLAENRSRFEQKWGRSLEQVRPAMPSWNIGQRPEGGLLLVPQAGPTMPGISLCMIVRDEADKIQACLESVRPYVDEMIVVDTGSTDTTAEICRSLGAKVVECVWSDSFAEARNASLQHATGDWVLWLDADDVMPKESGELLRRVLSGADETVLGFIVEVHCPAGPGEEGEIVVDHVKLVRNRQDLRFELRVHEQILPSIRRAGGHILRAPIRVVHANYDHSPSGQRKKRARDQRLLALDLKEHPEHPFVHFNIGMTAYHEQDYPRAVTHLRKSIDLSQPEDSQVRKAYALMAGAKRMLGQACGALAACAEGLGHYPDDPELLFNEALGHHDAGELAAAEEDYRRLLKLSGRGTHLASIDTGILSYKARHNLATLLQEAGRASEAEDAWRQVITERPAFSPAWLALGGLLVAQGRRDDLERLARQGQRVDGATGHLLRGLASLRSGDFAAAENHLRAAVVKIPTHVAALRLLTHTLLRSGERSQVEAVLRRLVELAPDDGEALHNLSSLLVESGRPAEALGYCRRAVAIRPDYRPSQELLAGLTNMANADQSPSLDKTDGEP